MNFNQRNALVAVGFAASAALGFAVANLNRGESPATEEHSEAGEGEHEEAAAEENFVALTAQEAAAAGVEVTTVSRGGGAELLIPGRVVFAPDSEAAVGAPLGGVVEAVHVALGTQVGAGAPLATIRSPEGASLRASADAARAEAEAARSAYRREDRLLRAGVVARQDWEAARANALKAEAQARAAQAQLAAVGAPASSGRTTVRSPIAGTITAVATAPGGFVTQGATVAQVANQNRVELVFDAPAGSSGKRRPGTPIFATDAAGQEIRAIVRTVSPNAQNAGAQVRASASGYIPPAGTPISGRVLTGSANTLVVPSDAIQTVGGRTVVFVAERSGFRAVPVVPGRQAAGKTEILRGLGGDERIAGRGAFLLKAELSRGEAEHEH